MRGVSDFPRAKDRYQYLFSEETALVAEAFDNSFATVETKETERGIAIFSKSDEAIPETAWLSDSEITAAIEPILHKFGRIRIPVSIVERTNEGLPSAVAAENEGVSSGFVFNGRIHLVKGGLADTGAVVRTMFHEIFHYRIRRFMTFPQYIQTMQQIRCKTSSHDRRTRPSAGLYCTRC